MKHYKLSWLIVVALLAALLVPCIAMAEAPAAAPTLTIGEKKAVSEKLTGALRYSEYDPGITWTATGMTDAYIIWASTDQSAVGIIDYRTDLTGTTIAAPIIRLDDVCKDVMIKGTVYVEDPDTGEYRKNTSLTAEFPVTLELVPETTLSFKKDSYKLPSTKVGDTMDFQVEVQFANPTEAGYDPTYGIGDLYWKVDNTEYAEVSKNGVVTFKKAGGTVTLTATTKGTKQSATTTLAIASEQEDDPQAQEGGYTYVAFTADTFTFKFVEGGSVNLDEAGYFEWKQKQGYFSEDELLWSSSITSVATVNNGGTVSFKKAGETTITVRSKLNADVTASCKLVLTEDKEKKVPFDNLTFAQASVNVYKGDEISLYDYLSFAPLINDDTVIWLSSDPTIATVSDYGWVSGLKVGKATITAKSKLGDKAATIEVNVIEDPDGKTAFTDIKFTVDSLTLVKDDGKNLNQYVQTTGGKDDSLVWTSSDTAIVSVDANGGVNAKKAGEATITAKSKLGDKSATLKVIVKENEPVAITEIKQAVTEVTVYEYDSVRLGQYLTLTPEDNDDALIFTSDDETIATVSKRGSVIAWKAGTATITVRTKLGKATPVTFKITVKPAEKQHYEKLEFTDKKYTVKSTAYSFNASKYLLKTPVDGVEDSIIWTVSDPQVASVNDNGVVYWGVGVTEDATVTITARSKNNSKVSASCVLEIKYVKEGIESITAVQDSFTLTSSDRLHIEDYIVVEPADYSDDLIWTSSDPAVATVEEAYEYHYDEDAGEYYERLVYVVVPGIPGEAKITVRSKLNSAVKASVSVKVAEEKPTKLAFIAEAPTTLPASEGSLNLKKYLTAEPWYYADSNYDYIEKLVWSTSDPQVATVSNGTVQYVAPGTATITVSDADETVSASLELTMTEVPATKIAFSTPTITLRVGNEFELAQNVKAIKPANSSYDVYDIVWSSSNEHVASIEDGVVVANEVGTAKITALIRNQDDSVVTATFKVKVTETGIDKIKFGKSKYTFKTDKGMANLKFTVTPADADFNAEEDLVVSSNYMTRVEVVGWNDRSVQVQIKAPGSATISIKSARDGKVLCKTKVVVEAIPVKAVKLKEKTLKMNFYKLDDRHLYQNTHRIYPIINPANAWYTVTWETSNASVAFVQNHGSLLHNGESGGSSDCGEYADIVATGEGTATLKMLVDDGKNVYSAKLKVIVTTKQVDLKMSKSKATINLVKGGDNTLQLEAIDKETGDPVNVKWTSSDKKIATVDRTGLVTALKDGKVTITATTKDGNRVKAACLVTVKKLPVKSIAPSPKKVTMNVGEEAFLIVTVKPADAYNPSVSFKSSDAKIVAVDKTGKLTARKAGKATITITARDGSKKSAKVTVVVKNGKSSNLIIEAAGFDAGTSEAQFVSEGSEDNCVINFE